MIDLEENNKLNSLKVGLQILLLILNFMLPWILNSNINYLFLISGCTILVRWPNS